ncbi:Hypothetical predicted protein [Paramuricea clavata]|nr:Hypothetical predicted protein [Paramuricea clavata]
MFILAWMIWNVILIVFWIVFLARKYNELEKWERTFRFVAIFLMAFAEIPVFSYFRYLRVKHSDPESNFSWVETRSDKVYKNLSERPSFSSIDAMFGKTPGVKNPGFQSDSTRNSTISLASEEIEESMKTEGGKVDKVDGKEIMEIENEKVEEKEGGREGEQKESDVQSQSSFEISVTVHTTKPDENMATEVEANESSSEIENSEKVENDASTPELPPPITKVAVDIAKDEKENEMGSAAIDSSVVVEMEGVGKSSHLESGVAVEIDVTDTVSVKDVNQTSF